MIGSLKYDLHMCYSRSNPILGNKLVVWGAIYSFLDFMIVLASVCIHMFIVSSICLVSDGRMNKMSCKLNIIAKGC